jgi:YD repeat-containing protein
LVPFISSFIVRDANGQQLAYVYFEERRSAAKLLTSEEARRTRCIAPTSSAHPQPTLLPPGWGAMIAERAPDDLATHQ